MIEPKPIRDVRDILRDMIDSVERGDLTAYVEMFRELEDRHKAAILALREHRQWTLPHP